LVTRLIIDFLVLVVLILLFRKITYHREKLD
jgi:hypothetical protein